MSVKFGVRIDQADLTYEEIRHLFISLEKLGFHSAFVTDHFYPILSLCDGNEKAPFLENWVLLSALAVETSTIRIGTNVNCNSYRHPAMLAKMGASLDVMSGGRLEFMIGAGWYEPEYKGVGIPFPLPRMRIEQMKEAIQVIRMIWTEHRAYFKGKHYHLEGALNYPKPLQKPYPRIWVGGGGEKYTLRAVAEVGDGTNFSGPPDVVERKLNLLRKYCEETSRDYGSIAKSISTDVVVSENKGEIEDGLKKIKTTVTKLRRMQGLSGDVSLEELEKPRLIGTTSEVMNKIEEYRKLGVDYFIIVPGVGRDLKDTKMMKFFAEKIIAAFK